MKEESKRTQDLLYRISKGDEDAFQDLFALYRDRLLRFISLRIPYRMARRVGAEDILQEAHKEAACRVRDHLESQNILFYTWLRRIAMQKLVDTIRYHFAEIRDPRREALNLPTDSSSKLVQNLMRTDSSPSRKARRAELAEGLKRAFERLDLEGQEIVLMHHFEQLSYREIAVILGINEEAARKRCVRTLERLGKQLKAIGITGAGHSLGRKTAVKVTEKLKKNEDASPKDGIRLRRKEESN